MFLLKVVEAISVLRSEVWGMDCVLLIYLSLRVSTSWLLDSKGERVVVCRGDRKVYGFLTFAVCLAANAS